ncbi:MAG: hypothetical protein IPP57_13325 [Candidatus Obscuribacter sp.]|nr:hypothetical protein [Candidatus Obscuribacter sp.]
MSIIDNLVNTIQKEVGKVQEKSQEMMQGFNLSNQIKELERKKNARLIEIGRAIFDKYEHQKEVTEETLKDWVAECAALDHEMAVLQAELDQTKVKTIQMLHQHKKQKPKPVIQLLLALLAMPVVPLPTVTNHFVQVVVPLSKTMVPSMTASIAVLMK